ncbi:hypothetical protein C8R47DRAFT_1243755 [Mycena vitilis]|nr:hypothetical protein C8R47DRAFT_1243755 [Mycena vitilis]
MGVFELYCSFCAGPLCDARSAWLSYLGARDAPWPPKDGEWRNPPGFPVPSKSKEDIVCITSEDGAFWNDWVCVGPKWKDGWVSPPCEQGDYGEIFIDGSSDWQDGSQKLLRIHKGCLAFLCRRVGITPQDLWESLYQPGADYLRYGEQGHGLLYCLKYYDMDGRNDQEFGYAIARQTPRQDEPDSWILTRPTCLPLSVILEAISPSTSTPGPMSSTSCMKLFSVPELLNLVLSAIIEVLPCDAATELKEDGAEFDPPSLVSATKALLALCQVNRFFHDAIIRDRQGLFLLLALQYGWMLPSTTGDWKEWRGRSGPQLDLPSEQELDWHGYLLTFLRKEERVVKNRWRMHRMSVQFARGRARVATETTSAWSWNVGSLGLRSGVIPPEAWACELI